QTCALPIYAVEVDYLAAFLTAMLIADAPAVLLMHLMHAHIVAFGRRVQLDRQIDETERDRPGPNGSHPPIETQPGGLDQPPCVGHRGACSAQSRLRRSRGVLGPVGAC